MNALDKALTIVKKWEGCKLKAYTDQGGRVTIGWGSTGSEIQLGLIWSQQQADERLASDVEAMLTRVKGMVKAPVNDNQLAALTSFAYNVGPWNLQKSGLLRLLNQEKYQGAADQFLLWNKIGHYVSQGLTNRREDERSLFLAK